jgi:hypothetical protein
MATRAATNATPEIMKSPIVKPGHRGKWSFLAYFLILVSIILLFLRETFQSWETGHFEVLDELYVGIDKLYVGIDELYVINRPSLQSSERFSIARVPLYSSRILESTNPLILFDRGPCFWVAQGAPVHDRTGGEYIWCKSILARLVSFGNEVFVTNSSKIAMVLSMIAHKNGHHAVTISHWGWEEIGAGNFSNSCLPVPAIGKDCLIKMNF